MRLKMTLPKASIRILLSIALGASILGAVPLETQVANASSCSSVDRSSGWNARENAKPGVTGWDAVSTERYSGNVSGWFDNVSASCGESVGLHLSGNGRDITVRIYRMGYYNGALARLVSTQIVKNVRTGAAPTITSRVNTVSTHWPTSITITITPEDPTGIYMARFDDGGKTGYAPLIIKDDLAYSPLLLVASTMTWQAYNSWGGWNLYGGPDKSSSERSRIVSFNRPYSQCGGEGNYKIYEAGLVQIAERNGLDITYITDNDLDAAKSRLNKVKAIIFGGHSEYWSVGMQDATLAARDFGINVLFFGGNQAYWRARLENNGRNLVVWKHDAGDPYLGNPIMVTNKWGDPPSFTKENQLPAVSNQSTLLGELFSGIGVKGVYQVADASRWPIAGSGLKSGDSILGVVGAEVDSIDEGQAPAVETILNSTVTISGTTRKIAFTYYNSDSQAGVIDAGSNGWVCSITDSCPWTKISPVSSSTVSKITKTVLIEAMKGPLGNLQPAQPNVLARDAIAPLLH